MIVGKFMFGVFKALPVATYLSLGAESVPHQVYEVRATVVPMYNLYEVAERLRKTKVPDMDIIAFEVKGDTVRIQVTGSPFLWAPFLAILPSIIGPIIGLVIGLILIFKIPDWAWAAIPLGVGGAVLAYAVMKAKK